MMPGRGHGSLRGPVFASYGILQNSKDGVAAVKNIMILVNHRDMKPVWSERRRIQGIEPCFSHWIHAITAVVGKKHHSSPYMHTDEI
jgi:hypothetical protein